MAPASLSTEPPSDPDAVYQALIEAHHDLTAEQSAIVNTKLILLLANHIGDPAVITEAVVAAREGVQEAGQGGSSG